MIRFVDGRRRVGSGYRVAERFVLTAAHCVTGSGHQVWLPDGMRSARVVVDGQRPSSVSRDRIVAGVDLGLLEIVPKVDGREAPVAEVSAPQCARVDRTTAGRVADCVAIGYPEHMATPAEPFRTAQLDGWIPAATGLIDTPRGRRAGYLTLKAEGVPPKPLPTAEQALGRSVWAGMSGAAVFATGQLIGVVAEHHLPEGDGSLTVVPIEWVELLPEDERGVALRALGLVSVEDLAPLAAGTAARSKWTSVLPVAPPVLVDRPVLEAELRAALLAAATTPVVVWGMGGSGKSVLAARLARAARDGQDRELADLFPDGVAWVQVGRERAISSVQLDLARALGEEEPDLGGDWRADRARLAQLAAGRRGLVVLDDVWTLDHYEPFRLDNADVGILVTTRNQALPSDILATAVRVGELERSQSRLLLAAAAGTPLERLPDVADAVLQELGDLALGVAMVGAIIRDRGSQAWPGVLSRLQAQRLNKVAHRFADYDHASLLRAIDIAVDDLDPDDQQRWAELAVFAGQGPIPQTAMTALWHAHDDDFLDTADRLDRFLRRSLVQRIGDGRYRLHDLQYRVARLRLQEPLSLKHRQLLDGYRERIRLVVGTEQAGGWKELVACLAQLEAGNLAWGEIDDTYVLDHLIHHLGSGGDESDALGLLSDYDWIKVGVVRRGVARLLGDYAEEPAPRPVRQIREALARAVSALNADPQALPDQLLGRLSDLSDPFLEALIPRTRQEQANRPFDIIRSGLLRPTGSLLHILTGHQGWVNAVAVTNDGRAVTVSEDGTAIVWDLGTGQALHTLTGHQGPVLAVAVTSDGRAVTGSEDGTAIVWDLNAGRIVHILRGHSRRVFALAVTSDGRAVTGGEDRTAMVWDLGTGRALHTLTGHQTSVDVVTVTSDGRAVTGSHDGTAMVWDLGTGRALRTLTGHQASAALALTARDDRTAIVLDAGTNRWFHQVRGHVRRVFTVAVTGDGRAVTGSQDGTAIVWDLDTGRALRTLTGHQGPVLAVAVTGDGRAVTGSQDGTAIAWDLSTGEELFEFVGHEGSVLAVAVTDDGRAVTVSDDGTAIAWDLNTAQALILVGHQNWVDVVAVTGDGRAVTGSQDGTAMVWDLSSGQAVDSVSGHQDSVLAVAVTGDGRAVTGSQDGTAMVWDLDTGEALNTFTGHEFPVLAVAVTGDGRAITASGDGTAIVWDLDTGEAHRPLIGHTSRVAEAAVTSDGRAVTVGYDQIAIVWDLDTGRMVHILRGHSREVLAVAITYDDRAVTGSGDGTAMVWDLGTGQALHTLTGHQGPVLAVAVTGDGRAVTGSGDGTAMVWDLGTGQALHTLTGHQGPVLAVAVTGDGCAVTGSEDGTAMVWDLGTGQALHTLTGHQGPVLAVAVTGDGRAVTGSDDRAVIVWDLAGGQPLASWYADYSVAAVECYQDSTVILGDGDGEVHILRLRT